SSSARETSTWQRVVAANSGSKKVMTGSFAMRSTSGAACNTSDAMQPRRDCRASHVPGGFAWNGNSFVGDSRRVDQGRVGFRARACLTIIAVECCARAWKPMLRKIFLETSAQLARYDVVEGNS